MREYFIEDPTHPKGGFYINVKNDHDCVFCDHCTDICWDYYNLVYMVGCELGKAAEAWENDEHTCEMFKEETNEQQTNGV